MEGGEPCLSPPFLACDSEDGKTACLIDQEGRVIVFDYHAKEFVHELAKVMNENSERLVESWKRNRRKT